MLVVFNIFVVVYVTDRQAGRQTDRQIDKRTDRQAMTGLTK